jgi:hypothetical protein
MRNDKSGPREDNLRKQEVEALVRGEPIEGRTDRRLQEDSAGIEPGRRPITAEPAGSGPSIDDINRKSDFGRWLRPSEFPADASTLVATATEEGAPDWVLEALASLPGDRRFATIGEAWAAVDERD